MDFGFERADRSGEFAREPRQMLAVDADAVAFHRRDHRDQRAIDAFVDARSGLGREARTQYAVEPPGHVGIFGSVLRGAVERHFAERDRLLARAADVLESQGGVAKVAPRQLVHAVAAADAFFAATGVEIEADHHRIVNRGHRDAVAGEDRDVVLGVLPDLEHRVAFEQRLQQCERLGLVDLCWPFGEHVAAAMAERDVAGIIGAERKAHPGKFGAHRIER